MLSTYLGLALACALLLYGLHVFTRLDVVKDVRGARRFAFGVAMLQLALCLTGVASVSSIILAPLTCYIVARVFIWTSDYLPQDI